MVENPFPPSLVLTPLSRRPIELPPATVQEVMQGTVPKAPLQRDRRFKSVSIVVVTYNNLVFTRLCLASVLAHTPYPNYEIIIVDNASIDGTAPYLRQLAQQNAHVRVRFNTTNRGFAAANNQGIASATGDVLVLLNNDTIVTPGWLMRLTSHLKNPATGAVGPVTNRCGNEAEIETSYDSYGTLLDFAQNHVPRHTGEHFDIAMLAMFCMALRRDTYEQIGPLDERFGIGMFEDDDYAMRLRAEGYGLVCATDVFVHHFGEASFGELACRGKYGPLFHANRQRFEEKWNRCWQPHQRQQSSRYQDTIRQIQTIVREAIPSHATVAVVSKGDEALLQLDGRRAWHFPQSDDGGYAGYYPANSAEAIDQLEAIRSRGATYLLVPQSAFWWLDYYTGLKQHLDVHYPVHVAHEDTCMIVALSPPIHQKHTRPA